MGDFSRDSFTTTENLLGELRGLLPGVPVDPRHYVNVRLQQGVPVLDADWNEADDIRKFELESVLVRAIGSGVPAGSDGFRVRAAGQPNDFQIDAGLLFLDGWLVYNRASVLYSAQPHREAPGVDPALPIPLLPAAVAHTDLVYLDAWERPVEAVDDDRLVDPRIGVETSVRVERVWVVRAAPLPTGTAPEDPAAVTERRPGHRYYPLATVRRQPGGVIGAGAITDVRRTHLTLAAVTHAPLGIDDPVRGQWLDSERLEGAFRGNLDALNDLFLRAPETFLFAGHDAETWQAMTAYQDVRATAIALEEQARNRLLHHKAAERAMEAFFTVQSSFQSLLQGFIDDGVAGSATEDLVDIYALHLDGAVPDDPQSLSFALGESDVLGAVLAQERLNEAIALESDTLPEGTVTANLIAVTPPGNVAADTDYQLTIRVQSHLTSTQGEEPILLAAGAGAGWSLDFQGTAESDPSRLVVTVPNQASADVVLVLSADLGAAATVLSLTARPQRRQQLVYNHPPVALAIGSEILPAGGALATLDYQGPELPPGNVAHVQRDVMAGGVTLPFGVTNLSGDPEDYQLTVTALGDDTGWSPPAEPFLPTLAPDENRVVNIEFQTADELGAVSPLTYRLELVRVTGGADDALAYTQIEITFDLQ